MLTRGGLYGFSFYVANILCLPFARSRIRVASCEFACLIYVSNLRTVLAGTDQNTNQTLRAHNFLVIYAERASNCNFRAESQNVVKFIASTGPSRAVYCFFFFAHFVTQ